VYFSSRAELRARMPALLAPVVEQALGDLVLRIVPSLLSLGGPRGRKLPTGDSCVSLRLLEIELCGLERSP
jgi:hypothetical protein